MPTEWLWSNKYMFHIKFQNQKSNIVISHIDLKIVYYHRPYILCTFKLAAATQVIHEVTVHNIKSQVIKHLPLIPSKCSEEGTITVATRHSYAGLPGEFIGPRVTLVTRYLVSLISPMWCLGACP